jgi:hypothetical protein
MGDLLLEITSAFAPPGMIHRPESLTFTEESKVAAAMEATALKIEQRGWLHSHDLDAIQEASAVERTEISPPAPEAIAARRRTADEEIDNRFFSGLDEALHRQEFPAASVALVVDAPAARRDPSDIDRIYGAFGTIDAVVVRRGIYLS